MRSSTTGLALDVGCGDYEIAGEVGEGGKLKR
jgi:hypothetical protein